MFISRDPIGLMGGNNTYAPNPIGWIDPFGLCSCETKSRKGAFNSAKSDAGIPRSQQPDVIFDSKTNRTRQYRNVKMTDKNGKAILDGKGQPIWTKEYEFTIRKEGKTETLVIQDHSASHKFPDGKNEEGSHFNIRPIDNARTGKVQGTKAHYDFN